MYRVHSLCNVVVKNFSQWFALISLYIRYLKWTLFDYRKCTSVRFITFFFESHLSSVSVPSARNMKDTLTWLTFEEEGEVEIKISKLVVILALPILPLFQVKIYLTSHNFNLPFLSSQCSIFYLVKRIFEEADKFILYLVPNNKNIRMVTNKNVCNKAAESSDLFTKNHD